ncbi:peptide-methionine (R)-S-oxide reductase MsrB [Formosa sp. A9]|uniref:peptide-methionine (R)-S-oxide reductase MsrB n=1 Tax=Formosa sp. A9 TaxID=3442641 RepID=UPI003EBAC0AF
MKQLFAIITLVMFTACQSNAQKNNSTKIEGFNVTKTESEWKAQLSPEAYRVLRESGTEPAYSSPLDANFKAGTYYCAACNAPLFKSNTKFDAGCGWPAFDQEIPGAIAYSKDSHPIYGTEEHCANCGSHLGHIFNDGPKNTTGKRHCINGVALKFVPGP